MEKRSFVSKKDIFLITGIIFFALIFYLIYTFAFSTPDSVQIMYDGNVVESHSLNESTSFSVEEAPNVKIEIKNGYVQVVSSDCPDKVCVHSGKISKAGQTIVCLPNKLTVRIVPQNNGVDTAI